MSKHKKPQASDAPKFAQQVADTLLAPPTLEEIFDSTRLDGSGYQELTDALGADWDLDDRWRAFERLLSDDLRRQYTALREANHKHGHAIERALYLVGFEMGKRLADGAR